MPWVVECDDYRIDKKYATKEEAERRRDEIDRANDCRLPHRVVEVSTRGGPREHPYKERK